MNPGDILDEHYQILGLLGAGGYGVVYKAKDLRLKREVAVKLIRQKVAVTWALKARSQREAQILSSLRHKNIVSCYAVGYWQSSMYCVMELVPGTNLQRMIELGPERRPNWQDASRLIMQVAKGMHHAHSRGIIHRDLTPGNILVTNENDAPIAKIVDFGLAGTIGEMSRWQKLTQPGEIMGTPLYMSPEQCSASDVDHRADIYSLGCILYHCLTGKPPFIAREDFQVMYRHIHEEPAPLVIDGASEAVLTKMQQILSQCMAKEAKDRYSSMMELHDDLAGLLDAPAANSEAGKTRPTKEARRYPAKRRTLGARSFLVAAALFAVLITAALFSPALVLRLAEPLLPPAALESASTSALTWLCQLNRKPAALQLIDEVLTKYKPKLSSERIAQLYLMKQQLEYAQGDYASAKASCSSALSCCIDQPSLLTGKNGNSLIAALCRAIEESGVSDVGDETANKVLQLISSVPAPRLIETLLGITAKEYLWNPQTFGKRLDQLYLIELIGGHNVDKDYVRYVENLSLRCKLSPLQKSIVLLRLAAKAPPQEAEPLARAAWAECQKHPDELPSETMIGALILAGFTGDLQRTSIELFANCHGSNETEDRQKALETLRLAYAVSRRQPHASKESALVSIRLGELCSELEKPGEAQSIWRSALSRTDDPVVAAALISDCAVDQAKSQSIESAVSFINQQELSAKTRASLRTALMDFGNSGLGSPMLRRQALQVLTKLPACTPEELIGQINAKLILARMAENRHDFQEAARLCQECFDELAKPSALSDAVRTERRIFAGFALAGCEYAMRHLQKSLKLYDEIDNVLQSPSGQSSVEMYAGPIAIHRATVYSALGQSDYAAHILQQIIRQNSRADIRGEAYCELARLEIGRNRIPEAKKALEEGFRLTSPTMTKNDSKLDDRAKAGAARLHETIASVMKTLALRSSPALPGSGAP